MTGEWKFIAIGSGFQGGLAALCGHYGIDVAQEEKYDSISLQKGQKVSLSKESAGLSTVLIGLGWDEAKRRGGLFGLKPKPIDCDASAFLLKNGKLADKTDIVYFGNLHHKSGTVQHLGDNLTGEGDGDDEQIVGRFTKDPAEYDRIVIVVNIYHAVQRKQHFGIDRECVYPFSRWKE